MLRSTRVKRKFSKLDTLSKIVISIPIINIISAFSVQIFGRDSVHFGIIRVIIFFSLIIIVLLIHGIAERVTKRLLIFMIYLFVLILFSSNFMYSLTDTYLKVFASMLMFPVGFFVLNQHYKLILFLKNFVYASLLICINYIIAQIFSIGRSVYLDDSFYYGYAGIGTTVILSYFLLSAPLLLKAFSSWLGKTIFVIVIFLSVLFTIVALKRIAILALFIGFIVYMFKAQKIKKGLKYILVILLFLLLTKPLYYDTFIQRLEVRTTESNELDQEQRYFDLEYALKDFRTKGLKHALVGTEAFNTPGYFGRDRQVHVDYANLLIGTGLIGLLIYLWIYFSINKKFKKYYHIIKKNRLFTSELNPDSMRDLHGVFTALIVASLIVSFSGGMHVITTRSILFTILGSLVGIVYRHFRSYKDKVV